MDLNSESDPYIKCSVSNKMFTTSTTQDKTNPVWNEDFQFITWAGEAPPETLHLEVRDKDHAHPDDLIGYAEYSLTSDWDVAAAFDKWLPVKLGSELTGEVRVKGTPMDLGEYVE